MNGSKILKRVGGTLMVIGCIDPLEGSVIILLGSALVSLGLYLEKASKRVFRYWLSVFLLLLVGVIALFGISSVGGIPPLAIWWALLIIPYPIALLMMLGGGIYTLVRFIKSRK